MCYQRRALHREQRNKKTVVGRWSTTLIITNITFVVWYKCKYLCGLSFSVAFSIAPGSYCLELTLQVPRKFIFGRNALNGLKFHAWTRPENQSLLGGNGVRQRDTRIYQDHHLCWILFLKKGWIFLLLWKPGWRSQSNVFCSSHNTTIC